MAEKLTGQDMLEIKAFLKKKRREDKWRSIGGVIAGPLTIIFILWYYSRQEPLVLYPGSSMFFMVLIMIGFCVVLILYGFWRWTRLK